MINNGDKTFDENDSLGESSQENLEMMIHRKPEEQSEPPPSNSMEGIFPNIATRSEPVRLVYMDQKTKLFKINQDGLNIIKFINQTGGPNAEKAEIGLVTINGPERSGKSYLLNSLLRMIDVNAAPDDFHQFKISAKT